MEYTIQDIIDATVEQEPTKIQTAFDYLIGQRVMDALENKKQEIAANLFNRADEEAEYETDIGASDAESQDTQSA